MSGSRAISFAFLVLLAGCTGTDSWAQTPGVGRIDDATDQFLQRQFLEGHLTRFHLTALPVSGREISVAMDSLSAAEIDDADRRLANILSGTTVLPTVGRVRGLSDFLYNNGRDFINYEGDGFRVTVNPLAYLRGGKLGGQSEDDPATDIYWRNTRGIDVAGSIGKHIFFQSRLEENQRRDPRLTPDVGNKSATRLGKATINSNGVLDYMVATGVVGFASNFFEVRFGRESSRLGYGRGSIMLSNFGPAFEQLQIRTTFGRVQYVNIFASLSTRRRFNRDSIVPKKYATMHRLEVNATDRLQFSIFETVIFATDSLDGRKGFDLAYLNPIIFYRAVEADRGSPDNVLLGGGMSYRPIDGVMVHAELLLDELRVSRIGDKWWANKWAGQVGIQAVPITGLLAGIEYSRIRPYMYSHKEPLNAYVHYQDFLGHPAGPNAVDWTFYSDYRIRPQVLVQLAASRTVRGVDTGDFNFGSNPLLSNETRVGDENISILQGVREVELNLDFAAGYELLPDLYLEAGFWIRRIDNDETGKANLTTPLIGFRWGIPVESSRY